MSIGPDLRKESFLSIPSSPAQRALRDALLALGEARPEAVKHTGSRTTRWEDNFEISPTGAALLADLIERRAENDSPAWVAEDSLHPAGDAAATTDAVKEVLASDDAEPPADAAKTETADGWTITHWLHENELSLRFSIAEDDDEDGPSYVGWISYDGCINWMTTAACYAHACGPGDIDKLKRAFEKLTELGAERMPDWCG